MKIDLKKISIRNFKGIQSFDATFNHITSIWGDNATGKTTIFDAFLWLFFGKNSQDASKFEVKRLDESGRFIKHLDAEVTATIQVGSETIEVKKVLHQKWPKRRGEMEMVYGGDENVYYWNDVPLKESEFTAKVSALINETTFRLITNPEYFNSIKWQDRRNILMDIAGSIHHTDVLQSVINSGNKENFSALIAALNQNKSIDEFKAEIAAKKKKIKDVVKDIPGRIDEVSRQKPEPMDFPGLRERIAQKQEARKELEASIHDITARNTKENQRRSEILRDYNNQFTARGQKIFDLKTRMQNIYFEVKQAVGSKGSKASAEIKDLKAILEDDKLKLEQYTSNVRRLQSDVAVKETEVETLRTEYGQVDASILPPAENDFTCPTCHQSLPAESIEQKKAEMLSNFNTKKSQSLSRIMHDAGNIKAEIDQIKIRIENGKKFMVELETKIKATGESIDLKQRELEIPQQSPDDIIASQLASNEQYQSLKAELAALESTKLIEPAFPPLETDNTVMAGVKALDGEIEALQREMLKEAQIERANARIKELADQETAAAQELASLEATEFAIAEFMKAKIDVLESRINSKFKNVRFKMFNQQVNGGESEACETLVNSNGSWVPFSDANNGARIKAGIDIINTLCEHYDVSAPIFIDNRESVTGDIDSDSQIINLIVSMPDKKLRVA